MPQHCGKYTVKPRHRLLFVGSAGLISAGIDLASAQLPATVALYLAVQPQKTTIAGTGDTHTDQHTHLRNINEIMANQPADARRQ